MTEYENACVGCDYCVHCGRAHTPYTVCDECGEDCREVGNGAFYDYDGQELCEVCAEAKMDEIWSELSVSERLDLVIWDRDEFATIEGAEAALDEYWSQADAEEKLQWFDDFKEVR